MNIYKLVNPEEIDYDMYDSMVVCAGSDHEARHIYPNELEENDPENWWDNEDYTWQWTTPDKVRVTFIGTAKMGIKSSVICASFNAG